MVRVKNVKDTIYLLIYTKPRYAFELSDILYGRENKAVFTELKKLENDNCIEEYKGKIEPDLQDGRSGYRKYYQANLGHMVDSLIKHINETTLKLSLLEEGEARTFKHILRKILSSQSFRYWIDKNTPENFAVLPISTTDFILTFLDILSIIYDRNTTLKQKFGEIHEMKDYYNAIDILRKNEKFNSKIPKLMSLLYGEGIPEDIEKKIKADILYLFIAPKIGFLKSLGFSDFGSLHYMTESLSQDISKIL